MPMGQFWELEHLIPLGAFGSFDACPCSALFSFLVFTPVHLSLVAIFCINTPCIRNIYPRLTLYKT